MTEFPGLQETGTSRGKARYEDGGVSLAAATSGKASDVLLGLSQ